MTAIADAAPPITKELTIPRAKINKLWKGNIKMNIKSLGLIAAMATAIASPLALAATARAQEIEIGPRGPRVEFGEGRHEGWRHHHDWDAGRDWRWRHHHRRHWHDYDEE